MKIQSIIFALAVIGVAAVSAAPTPQAQTHEPQLDKREEAPPVTSEPLVAPISLPEPFDVGGGNGGSGGDRRGYTKRGQALPGSAPPVLEKRCSEPNRLCL